MMKCEMGIALPASYMHNSNCFLHENKNTIWTHEENKLFENALALYDKDTSDRWQKVAEMIPGKTTADVLKHYKDLEDDVSRIEAGLIPIPGYSTSSFTLQWVNRDEVDGLKSSYAAGGKRLAARPDQERKKGVPWTEDEHRRFLMGLKKYGKGDWRNISRNFVITRTPTQVASHAQKYFIRQCSGGKDKRRSSIHDITTVNLTDERSPSPSQSSSLSMQNNLAGVPKAPDQLPSSTDSKQSGDAAMVFSQTAPHGQGNPFEQPLYGITSYGLKMQVPNYQRGDFLDSQVRPQGHTFCCALEKCGIYKW